MKKRFLALVLACLMLFTPVFADENVAVTTENVTEAAQTQTENQTAKTYFSDVPADSPYAEAITKMVESGIINGYGDNTFRPENGITRAEMCKMINLTFNYVDTKDAKGFPDVTEDKWYAPYILAAQKQGYVEGYEDGTFRPENNITRQEVCVIINRIVNPMDLSQFGMSANISDEVSDWAKKAVELIVLNNFMPLEENNTFRAKENIKRYELAALLSLFVIPPAEPLTATVSFYDYKGNLIGETDTVYIGDYPANVPDAPEHEDSAYEFVGWREMGTTELADAANSMILGDVKYEAVYELKKYKVEFYDGGTLFDTITVVHGEKASAPEKTPELAGYDFAGWSFQDGGEVVSVKNLIIETDMVLYAVYIKQEGGGTGGGGNNTGGNDDGKENEFYEVYFYVNEEIHDTQSILYGTNPKLPLEPVVENEVFLGWSLKETGDKDDVIDVTSYVVRGYTDFYAIFKGNPNDPALIEMLERGIEQISKIALTNSKHKTARAAMRDCMKLVLADAKAGIHVTKSYVGEAYSEEIADVEYLVLDEMSGREASEFKTLLTNNVDKDVRDFLSDYFLDGEDIEI